MRRTPDNKRTALNAIREVDYDTLLVAVFDADFNLAESFTLSRETVELPFVHNAHANGIIPRLSHRLLSGELIARVDLTEAYRRISSPRAATPPSAAGTEPRLDPPAWAVQAFCGFAG